MGRTPKPTKILIHPDLQPWEEIKKMAEQGHEITEAPKNGCPTCGALQDYDMVIGPNCWRMDESLRPYLLSHMLPAAREVADARKAAEKQRVLSTE